MDLVFYIKQVLLFICLLSVSRYGDKILSLEALHENISLRCIVDNITHICLGIISWLIVSSYETFSVAHVMQSLLCGLIAGSIDLDHFLMAKSLKFKDAINLSSRPPFHNTTLMAMLAIFLISLTHLKGNELCEYIGWYILVATISHHLRDALRHGLWIWPWTTKVLHFISYLILSYLFPLAVGFMLRINKRIIFVKVKTFDVIQV